MPAQGGPGTETRGGALDGPDPEAETRNVLDKMHLRPGIPWTIPILLAVNHETADKLKEGSQVAIEDDQGDIVAILHLAEKFSVEHQEIASKVYGTTDQAHMKDDLEALSLELSPADLDALRAL